MTRRQKISIPATIATLIGVSILISLGVWQIRRLEEKTTFIARLDAAYSTPQSRSLRREDTENSAMVFGRVEGVFLTDKALLSGLKVRDGKPGHDLIIPMRTQDGDVVVNLGWTDLSLEDKALKNLTDRSVWIIGLARAPSWNSFTPENRPEQNIWYRLDIPAIAKAKELQKPWPLVLYAERASQPLAGSLPDNSRFYPNNNHLQYALFWFSMAFVLIVIYVLRFIIGARRP